MKILLHLLVLSWLVFVTTACTPIKTYLQAQPPIATTPDTDVGNLVVLSERAAQLVRKQTPDPILHQIDTDLKSFTFRFTDKEATKEISIFVQDVGIPPEQWATEVNETTPLVGNTTPGLNLGKLIVGPNRVAQALLAHWPGCTIRFLTLYSENDHLTWAAFCNTSEGVVAGAMDGERGVFTPSNAPPASLPVTATPLP